MNTGMRRYRNIVAGILDQMKVFGDTEECVAFVKSHNGQLADFAESAVSYALGEIVKNVMRTRRLPENRNVPAFPSIEVDTGEVDENGEPIMCRKFASMKQLLLGEDWVGIDNVVDSYVKRARSNMRIANTTVKVARLRGYQRDLPFPDIDDAEIALES